jgi:hypothetical protein
MKIRRPLYNRVWRWVLDVLDPIWPALVFLASIYFMLWAMDSTAGDLIQVPEQTGQVVVRVAVPMPADQFGVGVGEITIIEESPPPVDPLMVAPLALGWEASIERGRLYCFAAFALIEKPGKQEARIAEIACPMHDGSFVKKTIIFYDNEKH